MPIDFDIGDGADALGRNQLSDALDGTYWVSGWDATLGTGDLEVDIAAGSGAINGGDVSTGSTQTVDFTGDVDATDPRKAVISMDDTGTVQKTLGLAAPAAPTDEVRFRTYDPQPPTNAPGVVVAEVWLAAGVASLESADVRDRRVSNSAVEADTTSPFTKTDDAETFEEADVTVSHSNTRTEAESVELGIAVGSTTDGPTLDETGSGTDRRGYEFNPNTDLEGVIGTVASGSDITTGYLSDSAGNVLAQSPVEDGACRIEYELLADTDYLLTGDAGGATYDIKETPSASYPYTGTDLDLTSGVFGGSTLNSDNAYNFASVAGLASAESGSAILEWPAPTDIYRWDAATFSRSEDGETVEVYIEDQSGNELAGPIDRGGDIPADPADNPRFRVDISRSDTANNPTLDSIYRRFEV